MALYGGARDISFFRNINRELMGNIISQQCVYYKFDLGETKVNIYGEASKGKYYHPPIIKLFNWKKRPTISRKWIRCKL